MSRQTTRFIAQYETQITHRGKDVILWQDWSAQFEGLVEAEEGLQQLVASHRHHRPRYATGRYRVICRSVVVTENTIGDIVDTVPGRYPSHA